MALKRPDINEATIIAAMEQRAGGLYERVSQQNFPQHFGG